MNDINDGIQSQRYMAISTPRDDCLLAYGFPPQEQKQLSGFQKTSVKCRLMNLITLEDWERRCRDSRKMFHEEFTRRKILKNSNKLFSRTNFALLSIDTFRATFSLPLSLSLISFLLNLYFLLYLYIPLSHLLCNFSPIQLFFLKDRGSGRQGFKEGER